MLLEAPARPQAVQGEFEPVTTLENFLRPWQRPGASFWAESEAMPDETPGALKPAAPALPIKLETRGVTQQSHQQQLLNPTLIHKASIVAKLREVGALDIAEPLDKCHSFQGFAQCNGCRKVRSFWNRCDRFYCPTCAPRLSHERAESIRWWATSVMQPKHVVLTVRNTALITFLYVKWFKACLTKLRRSKLARGWRGGLWSLEVTNEGRGWHLHAHLLVDVAWIDVAALARKWGELVGQDYAIVNAKDARQKDYLKEVCKYAVKGSQLATWSGMDIAAFVNAFTGNRTFGVFGTLYGKRTQWREWLKSLVHDKGACECGCNDWAIFSEAEWDWHQTTGQYPKRHRPRGP